MSREILQDIINDFSPEKFTRFFRDKNRSFVPQQETMDQYNDESFRDGLKLGNIKFSKTEKLIVCTFKANQPLSERSGKKAQYEKGKKILKDTQSDAGVFIFYDKDGTFRFSLIYPKVIGNRRQWSNFRRFTYFVSREFTNKTYLTRIGGEDFSSLEKIKDAFSVEKVTKEFYENIANWYFWAVQHSTFPKDAKEEENGRNIAVIRLITRIIFIWFMRERGLVPKDLFNNKTIGERLKDLSPDGSTYYKAILQNLFFATLSTKKDERKFRSEIRGYKGYNPDFGNQNVFRFQELFKNPGKLKDYFGEIPFLNGGLFECLDDKPNGIYIDGFTAVKKNQPNVPNFLFFSGEQKADLNTAYGTKSKTYKVRGLLDILSSFNFTIDENSPDDQDIALDPELLGRVFENLLASFNPETSTTARKATGSYYTPREIVDYMVTESLKAYFKTHLSNASDLDKKIVQLFSTGSEENPFNKAESKKIVELIESVRIVDPAVGSGAFPMGALNKLVFILNKVDPGNELWKQAQLSAADAISAPRIKQDTKNRIEEFFKGKNADYGRKLYLIQKCIFGVDIQQIAVEIAKLRFFISLLVDEGIDRDHPDGNWGIEPLPNLDFKIMQGNSLISEFLGIDFDVNGSRNNKKDSSLNEEKIKSLKAEQNKFSREFVKLHNTGGLSKEREKKLKKHLEKIAKELKIIEKESQPKKETESENIETVNLIKEFERKKIDYQNGSDKDKKAKLKNEVEDLMIKLFETKLQKKYSELKPIEERAQSIPKLKTREKYVRTERAKFSKKHGFNLENIEKQLREFTSKKKTRPFFPWKLYFAEVFENGGFDIVIGNPPYGYRDVLTKEEKKHFRGMENIEFRSGDSAELFSKKCFDKLTKADGFLTFIIPKKSLYGDAWVGFRKEYWHKYCLSFLLDSSKAFENVLLEQNVFGLKKSNANAKITLGFLDKNDHVCVFSEVEKEQVFMGNWTVQIYRELYSELFQKISDKKFKENLVEGDLGLAIGTDFFSSKPTKHKLLKGIDIGRWRIKENRYLKNADKLKHDDLNKFLRSKVICQRLIAHVEKPTPHLKITATFDKEGIIITNTITTFKIDKRMNEMFWLSYINSTFVSWYAYNFVFSRAIRGMDFYNFYIQQIPIPKNIIEDKNQQKPFMEIVDKILPITKSSDYLENPTKKEEVKEYEKQIDQMVYKLYDLTAGEIKIVENN